MIQPIDGAYFLTAYFWITTAIVVLVAIVVFFQKTKDSDKEIHKYRRW